MSKIKNAQLRYRVIDRCLRNQYKPFPTKEDLRRACEEAIFGSSEGLDICDSTIEKDMFAMRMEFDAPIKYSKREKGYYYEDDDYSIDKIPLSSDDIEAIKFATNTLMQFRDVTIFQQFGSALDKIFDRVHIANNPDDQAVQEYVQFESAPKALGNEMLPDLLSAIREKQIVVFVYKAFNKKEGSERHVLPLLLKQYSNRWYLISYLVDDKKIRTFALDRMSELNITDDYYFEKTGFDSKSYFAHSVGITANEMSKAVKVVFRIKKLSSRYIQTQPIHASQTLLEEGEEWDTFEMQVILSTELERTILANGSQIEILEPKELRDKIAEISQNMGDIYS